MEPKYKKGKHPASLYPSRSNIPSSDTSGHRMRSVSPLPGSPDPRRWSHASSDATLVTSPSTQQPPRGPPPSNAQSYMPPPMHHIPDKPLIDYVTNEWKSTEHKYPDYYKTYDEDEYGQFIMTDKIAKDFWSWPCRFPRRTFKYLVLYCIFITVCIFFWMSWLKPVMDEEDILDASYNRHVLGTELGTNAQPEFVDMVHLKYLDSKFIPGATHSGIKRLVVIGDVHGCKEELTELLKKLEFSQETDHLIFVGDIIFKGPDSPGVVNLARSLGATCVRGNHEDRMLLAWAGMRSNTLPIDDSRSKPNIESQEDQAMAYGDTKHRQLAGEFDSDQIEWLQKCPVILNIGQMGKKDYVVVHAGLAPGIRLEKQDPFHVMNMRTIDLATRVPSEMRGGEPWEKVWNHFQANQPRGLQKKTVIYGHDSRVGLNLKKYSRGLDSGCVRGGKLTALTIDENGKEKKYSVKCKTHWESPRKKSQGNSWFGKFKFMK
ncbi:Metallo-dependent phosphatase [Microthyrium microscopicum]|uniref:Metallo-dependent phosphatase n=1 Tax=Microthyrium microscopicum TaxID=703497 RepID=A0A6A6USM1_9PEZI|nr:Metallo-dependent phosphatase [Microthyrium microscopicum]